ncbi:hypothetical protein QMA61_33340 [Streptomyces coelicoflavus]|uniref:hypothetical protein n=1 Tax=Streptomyces coelicoflavus TaxID=285562 RepID=UPI0024AD5849|nr:hypothetical protein [Streptomyces coelicoflavus]MDI6521068.1 hypothetical protein [Streptomyces coelicoflavus]
MRDAEDGGPAERAGAEAGMGARHGEGDGRDAGPGPAPGDAPGTEALLAAALRGRDTDAEGERRAVAAFRAARDVEPGRAARTRRRDDWRPRTGRGPRRSLKTALSVLLASLTLGGVAYAAMGGGGSTGDDGAPERTRPPAASDDASVRPVATPPAATRDPGTPDSATTSPGGSTSPGVSTPPGAAPPDHPATGRDTEARCRAYERVAGRGKALEATAWQRLVEAAGGAERVEVYCAELLTRPTEPEPGAGTGSGGAGGNGTPGTGGTGAGIGADGTVGDGGVDVEIGGSVTARVPDQVGP